MADKYTTKSTSRSSADVSDRIISETSTTRKILRCQLVNNPNNAGAGVRAAIVHQRKLSAQEWEDIEGKPLSTLKAGEMSKLLLNSEETLKVHIELKNLFAIHESKGVPRGENNLIVGFDNEIIKTESRRAALIKALVAQDHSIEVWNELVLASPDLATKLCHARLQHSRSKALVEFESNLDANLDEQGWQTFFEQNTWIFGYGLNYKFIKTIQAQPTYGGPSLKGKGAQRGDFLGATEGDTKFTVLIEVKRPDTKLLGNRYRNSCYPPSDELAGGTAQLQTNCRKWETEGSQNSENREILDEERINTVQPRGILIIGKADELGDLAKRSSFEQYRRNLVNPEIITFDELLSRARFIVSNGNTS